MNLDSSSVLITKNSEILNYPNNSCKNDFEEVKCERYVSSITCIY
jgi:hypothetical protein